MLSSNKDRKKIYVGCALTHSPEEFRIEVSRLKNSLRKDFEVTEFIGLTADTPQKVYEHDIECVRACDLFLAICDYPGTGLGFELGIATEIGKPVLAVAHEDSKVTRLLLGIEKPAYSFHRYRNIDEVESLLQEFIQLKKL